MTRGHQEFIEDIDHPTRHLGQLEGINVRETVNEHDSVVPMLFLHGSKQSAAVDVIDEKFVRRLRDAATELDIIHIDQILHEDHGGDE